MNEVLAYLRCSWRALWSFFLLLVFLWVVFFFALVWLQERNKYQPARKRMEEMRRRVEQQLTCDALEER